MAVLTPELNPICIGADIGQLHDPTAVCVCETMRVDTGKIRYGKVQTMARYDPKGEWIPPTGTDPVMVTEYTVRHIARLPLGTSYPDVALHLADLLSSKLLARRNVRILLDVTGIGRAIYDDLKKEIRLRPEAQHVMVKPISFVHGEAYNRTRGTLGKAFLVSRLQSLLQSNRIHAPKTAEMLATLEELKVYEIKVSQDGKDTYGGAIGHHDDLATALALSCLEDPFGERVRYSERVY